MDLFVINLERSPERLREFQRVNPHLGPAVRFPAVDGKTADRADLLRQKIFEEPIIYTDGAIGNALSHLGLWEMASRRPSASTVLEDDAIVHKDFETLAPPLIAALPPDWDLVLWGWNFDTVMSFDLFPDTPCLAHFSQNELRKHWKSIQKGVARPSLHRLHYAFGTVGYSVSKAGAQKLAALAVPIKPFLYKIPALDLEIQNDAMDCVMAGLYGQINAFACFPPLVLTKNERAVSTVQQGSLADRSERSFILAPTDYAASRKFKKKHARYLFGKGDLAGATRAYLRYIFTEKKSRKR